MTSLTSTARGPASGRRHGRSRAAVEYQRTTVGASSVGSASLIVLAGISRIVGAAGQSACLRLAGRRRLKPPLGPSISEVGLRRPPVRSIRVRARPELERRWPGRSLRAGHRGDPGLGRRRSRGTSASSTTKTRIASVAGSQGPAGPSALELRPGTDTDAPHRRAAQPHFRYRRPQRWLEPPTSGEAQARRLPRGAYDAADAREHYERG